MGIFDALNDLWINTSTWFEINILDPIKDFFSTSDSYTGSSIEEAVNVDKELSLFKDQLKHKANSTEQKQIQKVIDQFDSLINDIQKNYPSEIIAIKAQQNALKQQLQGTIVDYVSQKASLSNQELISVLELQPGAQKRKEVDRVLNEMIYNANKSFDQKLKNGITDLNVTVEKRLMDALNNKKALAEKETAKNDDLIQQMNAGTLDMDELEGSYTVMRDAVDCLTYILSKEV